jgi:SAM-dependent methyltransferase
MARNRDREPGGLFKKEIPKMPEGYYSGDQPNPNLRPFVEQHLKEHPYDPETDDYDVPAFDKPMVKTKTTVIYGMHSYHQGKKPHDAIREYVRHFTKPGDLVLDPFCGSGSTALAALLEERSCVAVDISPAATFITRGYVTPVPVSQFDRAAEALLASIADDEREIYGIDCPTCNSPALIHATVFSTLYECTRCLNKVTLIEANEAGVGRGVRACCPHCAARGLTERISSRGTKHGFVPVRYVVQCTSEQCNGPFEVPAALVNPPPVPDDNLWFPTGEIPEGLTTKQPRSNGFDTIQSLFGSRNRAALSRLLNRIEGLPVDDPLKSSLKLAFTGIVIAMSRLQGYHTDPRFPNQIQRGTLYTPPNHREYNVFQWFGGKLRNLRSFYAALEKEVSEPWNVMTSTDSAVSLNMPPESVDYIFTDPAYGGIVQYAEANWIWEKWLGFSTDWWPCEIVVNEPRGITFTMWRDRLLSAMAEAYRVLKPNRWLTLCFHGSSLEWEAAQDVMAEAGFIPDQRSTALTIETREKSQKQLTSDKTVKRDIVVGFRKPRAAEATARLAITGEEDDTTFNQKVCRIVREYLGTHPGATRDRIYDELVSRMVRSGLMEAHDFDELLRQVAEEVKTPVMKNLFEKKEPDFFGTHEISRWYLKETQLAVADAAETAKEDKAVDSLSAFMQRYLSENPGEEGVHYSDLFEHYIYAVKDKPRRQLAEFLPDYFYKTEEGTWRLPASQEEDRAKAEARAKGLGRRVKRYLAQLEHGAAIPEAERPNDATLAEWIRHCKRAGLYEQGKLLYERGGLNLDNLTEEAMANLEEDYQVCARMLSRTAGAQAGTRRKD